MFSVIAVQYRSLNNFNCTVCKRKKLNKQMGQGKTTGVVLHIEKLEI